MRMNSILKDDCYSSVPALPRWPTHPAGYEKHRMRHFKQTFMRACDATQSRIDIGH